MQEAIHSMTHPDCVSTVNLVAITFALFVSITAMLASLYCLIASTSRSQETPAMTINQALKTGSYAKINEAIRNTEAYNLSRNMFYIHMFINKEEDKELVKRVVYKLFGRFYTLEMNISKRFSKSLKKLEKM